MKKHASPLMFKILYENIDLPYPDTDLNFDVEDEDEIFTVLYEKQINQHDYEITLLRQTGEIVTCNIRESLDRFVNELCSFSVFERIE